MYLHTSTECRNVADAQRGTPSPQNDIYKTVKTLTSSISDCMAARRRSYMRRCACSRCSLSSSSVTFDRKGLEFRVWGLGFGV